MSEKRNVPKLRFPEFSGYLLVQKPFRDVVESNIYGPRFNANDYDQSGNVKTIRGTDVDRNGGFKYEQIPTARLDEKLINTHKLKKGDLVMITTADCGLTGVFEEQKLPHISSAYGVRIRLNSKGNPYFFRYFFQTRPAKAQIDSFIRKATVSNLPGSDILKIKVHLPSLPEQQKIAEFLKAVDQRIELLQAKKEKLDAYKKAVMQKIFSQQLHFKADDGSEFPDWEEKKLGEVIKLQGGFAFKSENFEEAGVPVIRISNISNKNDFIDSTNLVFHKELKKDGNFRIKKGDLLIAMSGATTGKSSIYDLDQGGYLNQRVGLFRKISDDLFYSYLVQFVFSISFIKQLRGLLVAGAQPNISSSEIEGIKIPFPIFKEQQKIAQFLTSLDSSIENLNQQINQTQTWKKGLLQKMFV